MQLQLDDGCDLPIDAGKQSVRCRIHRLPVRHVWLHRAQQVEDYHGDVVVDVEGQRLHEHAVGVTVECSGQCGRRRGVLNGVEEGEKGWEVGGDSGCEA